MQLATEGECEPCPRGTFRTQGVEPTCQICPVGRTTPKTGATTIEECSLPICLPGERGRQFLFTVTASKICETCLRVNFGRVPFSRI